MLLLAFLIALRELPVCWIHLELFFAGKFLSYAVSSSLHLLPYRDAKTLDRVLMLDMIMIPVTTGVVPIPFALQLRECLITASVHATFVLLTIVVVLTKKEGMRQMLILTQFLLCAFQMGFHLGYTNPLYFPVPLFYLLSFLCYWLKVNLSDIALPWHFKSLYGWHEDFHTCLFIADLLATISAAVFLTYPSMDRHPDWIR
jgi:hypothetical protein